VGVRARARPRVRAWANDSTARAARTSSCPASHAPPKPCMAAPAAAARAPGEATADQASVAACIAGEGYVMVTWLRGVRPWAVVG